MAARRVATVAAAVLLAAPGAAWAQSAGDQQYSDPFAGQGGGSQSQSSQGSGDSQGSSGDVSGASDSSGSSAAPLSSDSPSASSGSSSSGARELPRTGDDAWLVALAGAGMMLVGAGLRLRVRADAR